MDTRESVRKSLKVHTTQDERLDTGSRSRQGMEEPASSDHLVEDASDASRSKRRSEFYSTAFAYREPQGSAHESIKNNSVMTVALSTNVIIRDEFTYITSFAEIIAQRYQRRQSSVLITLQHSSCVLFGGTFDPAYQVIIAGLPSAVQSTLNKRNAVLVQGFLTSHLGVPAKRGIVHFQPVLEENLATNGATVLTEIEMADPNGPLQRIERSSLIQPALNARNRQSKRWTVFKEVWSPVSPQETTAPNLSVDKSKASNGSRERRESIATQPLIEGKTSSRETPSKPKGEVNGWRAKRKSIMHILGR